MTRLAEYKYKIIYEQANSITEALLSLNKDHLLQNHS